MRDPAPSHSDNKLILPDVRGSIKYDVDMGKQTGFKVGGVADAVFKPADLEDLQQFLINLDPSINVTPVGVASNLIIRDGGIRGVVLRLLKDFTFIEPLEDCKIKVGAGATDRSLALTAAKHGIAGLEFFSGIPGTMGAAVIMNAGCYDHETKDVLVEITCLDRQGDLHIIKREDLDMQYRKTHLPEGYIVVEAVVQGTSGDRKTIEGHLENIRNKREESQPIREKTGGSTFANPWPHSAWKLVDEAGMRGFKIGDAQVSEKHCNFLINTGNATALDLEQLGETVRKRVFETSGIMLQWEIKRIGEFRTGDNIEYAQSDSK